MQKISLFIIYLNLVFYAFCMLEEETSYDLYLKADSILFGDIGRKGIIAFDTNSTSKFDLFNILDIADKNYDMQISLEAGGSLVNVSCNFWKPTNQNLIILCKLKEDLPLGQQNIKLEDYILYHADKSIKFFSEEFFGINYRKIQIPFLYSDKQTIDFNDGKKDYDIKFKAAVYNNENLVLSDYESFHFINLGNNCNINGKELICKIAKDKFENYLIGEETTFSIMSFGETFGMMTFEFTIFDIIIKYKAEKKNIDVRITKLVNNILSKEDFAAYETNIMEIPEVSSKQFFLNFTSIDDGSLNSEQCIFRKYQDNKPLLLLCMIDKEGNLTLSEIKEDIKLEDINAKYNFIIKPVNNSEVINIGGDEGGIIYSIYPETLDYRNSDNNQLTIGGSISQLKEITLFPESDELDCGERSGKEEVYIVCNIPKKYFEGKKNGYYYVHHKNHLGTKSVNYEAPPIKVILTEEEEEPGNASPYLKVNILRNLLILLIILGYY